MNRIDIASLVPTSALTIIPRGPLRRLPVVAGLAGAALLGTACTGSSDDDRASELGRVEQIVLSETTGDDGATEKITVAIGSPARLDLEHVEPGTGVELVSPSEYRPDESCLQLADPDPSVDEVRGLGVQDGVQLAFFVAEYADDEEANDAMSASSWCYLDYAADLAADRGFEASVSDLEQLQFMDLRDGEQLEFRIQTRSFDEPGPVVFSARLGSTVATVIDLDNQLDEFDAESLSVELAARGA